MGSNENNTVMERTNFGRLQVEVQSTGFFEMTDRTKNKQFNQREDVTELFMRGEGQTSRTYQSSSTSTIGPTTK